MWKAKGGPPGQRLDFCLTGPSFLDAASALKGDRARSTGSQRLPQSRGVLLNITAISGSSLENSVC